MSEKTIRIGYFCSDKLGEVEAAFDEKGNVLDSWSCDDAHWRHEYFNDLLLKLGIKVESVSKEDQPKLYKKVQKHWRF